MYSSHYLESRVGRNGKRTVQYTSVIVIEPCYSDAHLHSYLENIILDAERPLIYLGQLHCNVFLVSSTSIPASSFQNHIPGNRLTNISIYWVFHCILLLVSFLVFRVTREQTCFLSFGYEWDRSHNFRTARCVSDLCINKEREEKAVKVRVYKVLNYGIEYRIYCIK
jgi:hypothetical protein